MESGTVVINDTDLRNQVNEELSQIISKRESTIIENERKDQFIPARILKIADINLVLTE